MQIDVNQIKETLIAQSVRTVKQEHKVRNLGMKLLLAHVDQNIFNLHQSFEQSLVGIKQQIEGQADIGDKQAIFNEIKEELQIFIKQIGKCHLIWLQMLEQAQLQKQGNKIVINELIVITQIYDAIMETVTNQVTTLRNSKTDKIANQSIEQGEKMEQKFSFQDRYCDETVCNLIATVLNYFAQEIVMCYRKSKQFIIDKTQQVEQLIKNTKIMNSYILFALLKQLSRQSHSFIGENFTQTFKYSQKKDGERFCRYVQSNYQTIDLECILAENRILTAEQREKLIQNSNMNLINFMLIQNLGVNNEENIDKETHNQLLKTIIQNNDPTKKNKKWKMADIKSKFQGLFTDVGKNIEGSIKGGTNQVIKSEMMSMAPTSANISGGLGKCLVDIDQYEDVNEFFADLSKKAMIGGSITILLEEIPILNYFIIAGGLSYTVYRTYNDEITSSLKKMKQVGKASIVAVGSVGSTVTGMMVGGIVIPIPFLGAFIGGVIGGFFGQKGSRELTAILNNKSLIKLIKYLHQTVQNDSNWQYSVQLLKRLGISKKYFEENFCNDEKRDIKITGACFCVVTFYQSRRQMEYTHKKLSQKQSNESPKKQKITQMLLKREEFFVSYFNIVAMISYLINNGVNLIEQLPQFEKLVRHLIS